MRAIAAALSAIFVTATEIAAQERADLRRLVETPKAFVGKRIVVPSIGCVDDPKGGYVCVKAVGGQVLRIQAEALSEKTTTKTAERLLSDCKGTANLKRLACRVDAEVEPSNGTSDVMDTPSGSMPVTIIEAADIGMYDPALAKQKTRRKVPIRASVPKTP